MAILEEDTARLVWFVDSVRDDLDLVVSRIVEINPQAEPISPLLSKVWGEVKPRFDEIIEYLYGKRPLANMAEQLVDRGLVGLQLELKLTLYDRRRSEFRSELANFLNARKEEKDEKRHKLRGGGIFGGLFRVTNRILRSLGFIPGVDAVDEFKGAVEEVT